MENGNSHGTQNFQACKSWNFCYIKRYDKVMKYWSKICRSLLYRWWKESSAAQLSYSSCINTCCCFQAAWIHSYRQCVSNEQICTDIFTSCHTETEVEYQTYNLIYLHYTDAGWTSPPADPPTPLPKTILWDITLRETISASYSILTPGKPDLLLTPLVNFMSCQTVIEVAYQTCNLT